MRKKPIHWILTYPWLIKIRGVINFFNLVPIHLSKVDLHTNHQFPFELDFQKSSIIRSALLSGTSTPYIRKYDSGTQAPFSIGICYQHFYVDFGPYAMTFEILH